MLHKSSITSAIEELNDILNRFDCEEPVSIEEFALTADAAKTAIDRKAWLIKHLDAETKILKERAEEIKTKAQKLESFLKSLKSHMVYLIDQNPHLDFFGNEFKMKLVNNGGKQTVAFSPGIEPHTISRVVDMTHYDVQDIECSVVWRLKDGLEDTVREGATVRGLQLMPRGKNLRIT